LYGGPTLKLGDTSKGYGAVQRRVLAELAWTQQDWVSVLELAGDRGGSSRYESTRRAVASADDGAVETAWGRPAESDRFTQLLHVRLAQP
jgi:hypothetical protein